MNVGAANKKRSLSVKHNRICHSIIMRNVGQSIISLTEIEEISLI